MNTLVILMAILFLGACASASGEHAADTTLAIPTPQQQAVATADTGSLAVKPVSFKMISTEKLKKLIDEKQKLFLVDARSEFEYRQDHLPGAINIASYRFKDLNTLLPADKDYPLVFYCRGTG